MCKVRFQLFWISPARPLCQKISSSTGAKWGTIFWKTRQTRFSVYIPKQIHVLVVDMGRSILFKPINIYISTGILSVLRTGRKRIAWVAIYKSFSNVRFKTSHNRNASQQQMNTWSIVSAVLNNQKLLDHATNIPRSYKLALTRKVPVCSLKKKLLLQGATCAELHVFM